MDLKKIVCFGDSITRGSAFEKEDRWTTMLEAKLNTSRAVPCRVFNRGVDGNTTANALDRMDRDVIPLLPAAVLIQFGFNDANVRRSLSLPRVSLPEYQRNMREICRVVTAHQGTVFFIVNHTIDGCLEIQGNGRPYRENFQPYNRAVVVIAAEVRVPLIDLPAAMQQKNIDLSSFLDEDKLHLSKKGHKLYAEMVFEALRHLLPEKREKAD